LDTTIQDFKNASSSDSQQANATDEELQENAHFTTIAYEDFVVRFAREQLNDIIPQYYVRDKVGKCNFRSGFLKMSLFSNTSANCKDSSQREKVREKS